MQRLVDTLLPNLDTAPESTVVGPPTPDWVEELSGNSVFLHDHFRGNEPSLESGSWEDRSTGLRGSGNPAQWFSLLQSYRQVRKEGWEPACSSLALTDQCSAVD